ncbi:MAG: B12-binding domain-containing radical SAM protein [Nitrospirae bacterium]|nr:B12-binding domain-containing radical SAM protein [Nitrospirota bacterium]
MKRVVFVTFYDMICYGLRLLSSVARQCGVEPHTVLIKSEKSYIPVWRDKDEYSTYQYFYNGLMRGSYYAVDPVTKADFDASIALIAETSPSVVCISTRSFAHPICREFVPMVRAALPGVPIIAGGWGPTLEPEKWLEFCDYVCFGEGEEAVSRICKAINGGEGFDDIPNLIHMRDGSIVRNVVVAPLSADRMNALPFPDFDPENKYLVDAGTVRRGAEFYNNKVYDCFAARGCPMNCTYCMSSKYGSIYKEFAGAACPKYRLRSLDVVLEEVRLAKERGAGFIRFKDEVFPTDRRWVASFLERYPKEIGLPFFGFVRPEFHDPEIISRLHEAGLCVTMVGVQSGSQEIREHVYKRMLSPEKIVRFARTLADLKIKFAYHFIYRNPFETEAQLRESLAFAYSLPYGSTFIYKLEPFPGSPMRDMIEKQRPQPLSRRTADWYAILLSLSLKGPVHRAIARIASRLRLFKATPRLLAVFFLPTLLGEYVSVIKNRLSFRASLHFAPARPARGA